MDIDIYRFCQSFFVFTIIIDGGGFDNQDFEEQFFFCIDTYMNNSAQQIAVY